MSVNNKQSIEDVLNNSFNLAKDFYLADPTHDGKILIFGESDNPDNTAMWQFHVENDTDKEQKLGAFGLMFQHRNIKRYVVMTLAWMTEQSAKDVRENKVKLLSPSKDPARKEAMIVTYSDADNQHRMTMNDVVRDSSGKLIDIVPDGNKYGEDTTIMGIFSQVLNFKFASGMVGNDNLLSTLERMAGETMIHGEIRLPGAAAHHRAGPKAH